MEVKVGAYYQDETGRVVGPAFIWNAGVDHPFQIDAVNQNNRESDTLYRKDGTSMYGPNLVREVPKPVRLESGKLYILNSGKRVEIKKHERGDFFIAFGWHYNVDGTCCYRGDKRRSQTAEEAVNRNLHSVAFEAKFDGVIEDGKEYVTESGKTVTMSKRGGYFESSGGMHYNEFGVCCYNGKLDAHPSEFTACRKHDIVSKAETADDLVLKIELDTKVAQDIVAAAAADFEKASDKLLAEIADKDVEVRAAKEAFNVLHSERNALFTQVCDLEEEVDDLKYARAVDKKLLQRALSMVRINQGRIKRASQDLLDAGSLAMLRERENKALEAQNKTLSKEVSDLYGVINDMADNISRIQTQKWKVDDRIRLTRKRLKDEKAKTALLEAELKGCTSKGAMIRNSVILAGVLVMTFAFGAFFA